jgi:hypothetical protein
MRYAQVRSSISSSLRMNDALFGCTSWNSYAYGVPSRWVVQSPGVTNNNKESRSSYPNVQYIQSFLVHFVAVLVFRLYSDCIMAHWLCLKIDPNFSKKPEEYSRGACRIRLRREERKGGRGKIRTLRAQVGHGIHFGWVAGPMKSRDAVYLSPMRGSSEKLAASGMCLGPKDPGEHNNRINHGLVRLRGRANKKTNVKFGSPYVHWVRHHTHVASLAADVIRRRCVASPAANSEPCHQTSDQGHPDDTPDDTPSDGASIRVTLG